MGTAGAQLWIVIQQHREAVGLSAGGLVGCEKLRRGGQDPGGRQGSQGARRQKQPGGVGLRGVGEEQRERERERRSPPSPALRPGWEPVVSPGRECGGR